MAESNSYALFIWVDDCPVTASVLNLSYIDKPFFFHNEEQKRDFSKYEVGQKVEARFDCKSKKTARAIIGGIEDEANKDTLADALRDTTIFKKLLETYIGTADASEDQAAPSAVVEASKITARKTKRKADLSQQQAPPSKKARTATTATKKVQPKTDKQKGGDANEKKQKDLSQKELERIGEDLNLLELAVNPSNSTTPKHVITPNLVSESLELVNQGGDEIPFADIPSLEDHPHCKEVVERLKGMETHIQWLTSNIQSLYQTVNQAVCLMEASRDVQKSLEPLYPIQSTPRTDPNDRHLASSTSWGSPRLESNDLCSPGPFWLPCTPTPVWQPSTPAPGPSPVPISHAPGPSSSPCTTVPDAKSLSSTPAPEALSLISTPASSELAVYQGFTKDMLRNKVRLSPDFKKASATLFRLLYTEEETKGRSLKGRKASKSGQARPGLEDLSKLDVIYELINEKWPGTQRELINAKLGHLLKPSGNTTT